MVERYIKMLGVDNAEKFMGTAGRGLRKSIRCNSLKIKCLDLIERLQNRGIRVQKIPFVKNGFWILSGENKIGHLLEYLYGFYYIQTAASMIPPIELKPTESDIVLDMCAAPGGKTTHLAELMRNKGVIIATDINRDRMRTLRSHLSRMGVENVIAIRMNSIEFAKYENMFTKVLLDAPCSGEGLIPIDPERRKSRKLLDLYLMAKKQLKLLKAAIKTVKPGGIIIYSTCSIAPEENEFVINEILSLYKENVVIEELDLNIGDKGFTKVFGVELNPSLEKCRRLYPHVHETEGFFICKLRKIR